MQLEEEFLYEGSQILLGVSQKTGVAVDQLNFLVCQIVAVGLGSIYRTLLHPSKSNATTRHVFGLVFGLIIGYFCFGPQAIHLAGLPALCYIIIRTQSPEVIQRWVLIVSLLYLSCVHLRRQVYGYGSYRLDITGPLMVITQKVTSLAFNIHDGLTKTESEMTCSQQQYAVRKIPSPLEFFSYTFMFPTVMVGPLIYYRDYIDFIDGHSFPSISKTSSDAAGNNKTITIEPSPVKTVVKKVILSLIYALMFLHFLPIFPIKRIKDNLFLESTSLVHKFVFLMAATTLVRFKYYFAWTLSDAICNNSGLGFNGYDEDGSPKWNKLSNVDILGFEFSTNLKESIESWNLGTNMWLRMVVYERVEKYRTISTYALSAIWHGFYPGYYLTFANGALFTFAARSVRRSLRDHFLNSEHKLFYDVLTFIATRLVMAYITFSFILLEFWASVRLYMYMYWCLHILGLAAIFVLPKVVPTNYANKVSKDTFTKALNRGSDVSRHQD